MKTPDNPPHSQPHTTPAGPSLAPARGLTRATFPADSRGAQRETIAHEIATTLHRVESAKVWSWLTGRLQ